MPSAVGNHVDVTKHTSVAAVASGALEESPHEYTRRDGEKNCDVEGHDCQHQQVRHANHDEA